MTDESIIVQETGEKFSSSQLKEALRAAIVFAQNQKSNGLATVSLKAGVFSLKANLKFTKNISLKGEEGTNVVLDSTCSFEVNDRSLTVDNIIFSVIKRTKNSESVFKVGELGKLIMNKIAIAPEENGDSFIFGVSSEGNVEVNNSVLRNTCIYSNTALKLTNCQFIGEEVDQKLCCVTAKGRSSVKDCSFENFSEGIRASGGTATFAHNRFVTTNSCLVLENTKAIVERCEFTSIQADAVRLVGKQKSKILNSNFIECSTGVYCNEEVEVTLQTGTMKGVKEIGIFAGTGANVTVSDFVIIGQPDTKSYGLKLEAGKTNITDVKLEMLNYGVYSEQATFAFEGLNVINCLNGISWLESKVRGFGLNLEQIEQVGLRFIGKNSSIQVKDCTINEADLGISVTEAGNVTFTNTKLVSMNSVGFLIEDSSCTVLEASINNVKTKAIGIKVRYTEQMPERTLLDQCKTIGCSIGIEVIEEVEVEDYETVSAKTDLDNCSFVKCEVGFVSDGARASVKGCSFIMSSRHSIVFKNEQRKRSRLKIRWANFIEPKLNEALSNNVKLMTSMTQEKAFFGSEFSSALSERMRQARNYLKSHHKNSRGKARIIMRSVNHMFNLFKNLSSKLLRGDLLEDPELGMFAATFKLNGSTSTLIKMDDLLDSWKSLSRTRNFDHALSALNRAFNFNEDISVEILNEWTTMLEEQQRVCFINSKFNRRRDYLLTTAKDNPLSSWYFLDEVDPNTEKGKRLRNEVLWYLAKGRENKLSQQEKNFHASWVSQWAVNQLGEELINAPIPADKALREAWSDKLLDVLNPTKILDEYKRVESHIEFKTPLDELLQFEALCLYEVVVEKLDSYKMKQLIGVFNGKGQSGAFNFAASMFKGQGALPGFLRRIAMKARSPESLLITLSDLYQDDSGITVEQRYEVVIAVMGHYFYEDPVREPIIRKRTEGSYETCAICQVQKLQPWNELRLDTCKHDHRVCKGCFKNSMLADSKGLCAEVDKDNKVCRAFATRRDMEMVGLDKTKIYNILKKRVVSELEEIPGWQKCDSAGCIGGSSFIKKSYYICRLCKKVVRKD